MAAQKFNAFALDDLIKECTSNVDEISTQLATCNENQVIPAGNPKNKELINQSGQTVDFNRVYLQIEKLIENGNNSLQVLAAIDPDTIQPQTIHAMTALMNTIKNCIAEFTKIHAIHLKHELNLQMERTRQQNRLALIQARADLKKNKDEDNTQVAQLQEFSDATTNDIFRFLQEQKNKREEKK